MRDISTKVDNVGDTLRASDFNALDNELENLVTSTGQSLDPAGGPDTDLNMLGKAIADYAGGGWSYDDSGAADAYVLARASNLKNPSAYLDNMVVCFTPGNTNTGASTINVATLGVKNIKLLGSNPGAGDIQAGKEIIMKYDGIDFEIVAGERPLDEDDLASNSDKRPATQQSIKAYVDSVTPALGTWDAGAPWALNTAYLAATDGTVYVYNSGYDGTVEGLTDSSNPPTTVRIGAAGSGISFECKAGDYWKVTHTGAARTIYWLPLTP